MRLGAAHEVQFARRRVEHSVGRALKLSLRRVVRDGECLLWRRNQSRSTHDEAADEREQCISFHDPAPLSPWEIPWNGNHRQYVNRLFFFWKSQDCDSRPSKGNVGTFDSQKVAIDGSIHAHEGSKEATKGNFRAFRGSKETTKGSKEAIAASVVPNAGPKVTIKGSKVTIKGNIGIINGSKEATNGSNRAIEGSNRVHDGSKKTMKGDIGTTSGQKEAIPNSIRLHNGPKVTIEGSKVSFMGNVGTIKGNIGTIYGPYRTINGSIWAITGRHHVFRPSLADDELVPDGDLVERIATVEHIVHVRDLGRVEGGEAERCQGRKRRQLENVKDGAGGGYSHSRTWPDATEASGASARGRGCSAASAPSMVLPLLRTSSTKPTSALP